MKQYLGILMLGFVVTACVVDEGEELGESSADVTTTNKLAANKLAANKLAANKLAAQKLAAGGFTNSSLVETADGRDVLTYIVRCALTPSQSLTLTAANRSTYTFTGEIGLASAWLTRSLTVSEQKWVTACVLARTNYYGVQVNLSLRGDNPILGATLGEVLSFNEPEAAFYGNIFDPAQPMYACVTLGKELGIGSPSYQLRQCAMPNGNTGLTMCGFTYTGQCGALDNLLSPACDTLGAPYKNCHAPRKKGVSNPAWAEVITVELPNILSGAAH